MTSVLRPYLDEYSVEVSSPGSTGRCARARTSSAPSAARCSCKTADRRLRGEVVSAGERVVSVSRPAAGEPLEIAYDEIVRANLIDEG